MNKFLLDEYPLIVLPSLAKEFGLNEAIILQQLHYWLLRSKIKKYNKKWIFNTYDQWLSQFSFMSKSTLRRTLTNLEKKEIVISHSFQKNRGNHTKYYTINYSKLNSTFSIEPAQFEQALSQSLLNLNTSEPAQNEHIYYTETTRDYSKGNKKFQTDPKSFVNKILMVNNE